MKNNATSSICYTVWSELGMLWHGMRQMIAARGLYAKFTQNEELKKQLLETGDAFLVECAYKDLNWACGWHLDDAERRDISKWRGKNLLGFALMEVREHLTRGRFSCQVF